MKRPFAQYLLSLLLLSASAVSAREKPWIEVRSPNFIVVSNAGDKEARKAALQFEQIRAVFRQSLQVAKTYPTPMLTVLAVKTEDSMRELLPEYWAKGHSHPAGLLVGRVHQFYAAVNLEAHGANPYEAVYHEYYHLLTTPYFSDLPVWISEGLAEYYGHTEIDNKRVVMGQADPVLLMCLKTQPLIPLDILLRADRLSPYYNEQNKSSIFSAESWALTHYLVIGDRGVHQPMLVSYLQALDHGKTQQEAANEAFGDLKKLQAALHEYVSQSRFFVMNLAVTLNVDENALVARALSDAEADAYLGGFAVVRGRTQDARLLLEKAVQLDPNLALAYQYLGLVDFSEGHRSKALEAISQAIKLDPKNFFTRYLRAYLATNGGTRISNEPQIEEDLRQAIATNPEFAPSYGLLAVHLATSRRGNGDDLSEALSLAEKAVSLQPGMATYQLDLAEVLAQMKRYEDAKVMASHAKLGAQNPVEKARAETFLSYLEHPDSVQLHRAEPNKEELDDLSRARATLREGNYESGIEILQHVVESNTKSTDGWALLGSAYLSNHRADDAIVAFKREIEVNHDARSAYNNLGRAYWAKRDYEDAEAAFREQLHVNPSDNWADGYLGSLYLECHKYDKAALELQKAASIRPSDANLQVSLGRAYLNLGQDEKAMTTFDAAVKLSPTPLIWNNIAYYLALNNSHFDAARQYAQSAIKATSAKLSDLKLDQLSVEDLSLVPSIGSYWDTLGWIYYTAGDLDKAEKYLSAAWLLTQQSLVGDHLGQVYEKRGEKQKAIETYALALAAYRPEPELRQRLVTLVGGEEQAAKEANSHREAFISQRTVPLRTAGPANTSADYFVLLAPSSPGASGTRVEAVKFIKGDERLKNIEDSLRSATYPLRFAEDRLIKIVRRGTVSCSTAGDCSFVMMLPGDVRSTE